MPSKLFPSRDHDCRRYRFVEEQWGLYLFVYWSASVPKVPKAPVSGLFLKLRTEVVPVLDTATPFDIAELPDSRSVAVALPGPFAVNPAVVLKRASQLMRFSAAAAAFA